MREKCRGENRRKKHLIFFTVAGFQKKCKSPSDIRYVIPCWPSVRAHTTPNINMRKLCSNSQSHTVTEWWWKIDLFWPNSVGVPTCPWALHILKTQTLHICSPIPQLSRLKHRRGPLVLSCDSCNSTVLQSHIPLQLQLCLCTFQSYSVLQNDLWFTVEILQKSDGTKLKNWSLLCK